jgi:hypothetical protein
VADHHDRAIPQPRQPAHDGGILAKGAVPGQRRELGKERGNIVAAMRAFGVARHLAFAPRRQRLVEVAQHVRRLAVERAGLFLDIHLLVGARERAQFFGLALDLGEGFFEVEVMGHRAQALRSAARVYGGLGRDLQSQPRGRRLIAGLRRQYRRLLA